MVDAQRKKQRVSTSEKRQPRKRSAVHGETTVTTKTKRRGKRTQTGVDAEATDAIIVSDRFSKVSYGVSFTKGLPNYSSVKCDVHISLPCDVGKENSTFVKARDWALKRLKREIIKTMEALEEGLMD
ncbi:hypothetical protein LCGC14_2551440 [marine sediment metagenome]|uniref:Uncharacterized protein n=1 Tax=marine sediment metagenome TaxID=412755 RepID=A0A0F9CZ51_9ZZZZ